jgi:endonuclease G, mitochondrial
MNDVIGVSWWPIHVASCNDQKGAMLHCFQCFTLTKTRPSCPSAFVHIAGAILVGGGLFWYDRMHGSLDENPQRSSSRRFTLLDRNDGIESLKSPPLIEKEGTISPERWKVVGAHDDSPSLHPPTGPWRILRPNPYLEICFDTRTRNAVYVQHRLLVSDNQNDDDNTSSTSTSLKRQRYNFFEDTNIEEPYRSRNSYYHLSGYDRGHLAPAADFTAQGPETYHNRKNAVADTYNLCNISPQHSELNRKQWSYLEQWTRRVARKYWYQENKSVTYVTTGPLWLPRSQIKDKTFRYDIVGIGQPPSIVMVPTHFFKVIVVLNHDESRIEHFACFVLPNDPSIVETSNKSLQEYLVPWTDLEAVTGLSFYPDLADADFKEQADIVTETIMADATKARNGISSQGQPQLLLTDGASKGSMLTSKTGKSRSFRSSNLCHLCANQACAPRR